MQSEDMANATPSNNSFTQLNEKSQKFQARKSTVDDEYQQNANMNTDMNPDVGCDMNEIMHAQITKRFQDPS